MAIRHCIQLFPTDHEISAVRLAALVNKLADIRAILRLNKAIKNVSIRFYRIGFSNCIVALSDIFKQYIKKHIHVSFRSINIVEFKKNLNKILRTIYRNYF